MRSWQLLSRAFLNAIHAPILVSVVFHRKMICKISFSEQKLTISNQKNISTDAFVIYVYIIL
jgi:hypothetical protein